jgi:nicotinamide mononucleotide adenylyltransferase
MAHATKGTLAESAQALAAFVGKMEGGATLLDDEVVMARVINAQRMALEAARSESTAMLAASINAAMVKRLNQEVAEGATLGQAIAGLAEEMDKQWWQVERFVRTETSYAFNRAHQAGIEALQAEDQTVRMRWTEHVDDITGAPLDNRVGQDSLVLHGQVAVHGKLFHMPPDPRTPKGMEGKEWAHPPNRPNDRAVLLPWRSGWGVPAWEWRNGKRTKLRA